MNRKIHFIAALLILFASCKVSKKPVSSTTKGTANQLNEKADAQKDLTLFFDAEKARLAGNNVVALKLYLEYVKKNTNNATAYYNMARIYFQKKEINNAVKYAALATKIDPDNKYFQELYTQLLEYTNNAKQAENQYDALIKKNPDNEEYLYRKAMLYVKSKEYEKAIESLNELEKKSGFNEDLIIQKKSLYQRMGKTDLAIAELKKLRDVEPNGAQYIIMMADVYETGNQQANAAKMYEELEAKYPNEPLAQVALAQYYLENKNTEQYNKFMQQVMKNKNLDVETKIALIIPSLQKLENDTSIERNQIIEMAKSISEESPENKDAMALYADVLYYGKKYNEALTEYKKYLKLDQSKFNIWSQIMSIYLDQQMHDSVLSYSNQCISYFPNNPMPYFFMGVTYLQKKEAEKALIPLNKAAELEPENPLLYAQIYASLGDAYNATQKYELSDSCFEKALKILPDDATTLNNYAYYLSLRKNKLDKAEKMSKKSLQLQPDSKSFLDTYGWILYQQGKYTEAKDYIEKAIKAGGQEDGTLYEHLGDIYYKLNEVDKAKENWKKAKEKGEDSPLLNKKMNEGKLYEN
ncbi:MAG TPA: tetratricopeptide repeat protein [Chitinophagaceae bacterium]|jgi:tetratricopeptide (TPR) repeat protein|nr:tetratricopeptide repeat protein [Chitinophagaceae bacterium]